MPGDSHIDLVAKELTLDAFERGCELLGLDPDRVLYGQYSDTELTDLHPPVKHIREFLSLCYEPVDLSGLPVQTVIDIGGIALGFFLSNHCVRLRELMKEAEDFKNLVERGSTIRTVGPKHHAKPQR